MSIILNNQSIAGKYIYKEYIPQSYRYIGEIFQSILPIEDIRVALLDGHIIASSDGYGDFIQHLTSLSLIYPQLICTEDEWQTSNTTYGECGKFVINNDGSIRLPKIVSFVQGLKSLADLANIIEAGLPNITGSPDILVTGDTGTVTGGSGAIKINYHGSTLGVAETTKSGRTLTADWSFDASLSNSIYGNSNTVQPQAIQYPYYIVLATGVTQEITAKEELVVNNSNVLGDSKYSNLDIENTSWLKSEGQKNYRDNYPDYYDWIVKEYNGTSNNLKKDINVDKIGDLTVEDGVLSGFSDSNYAKFPIMFNPSSNPWEIVLKVNTGTIASTYNCLLHSTSKDKAFSPVIELKNGELHIYLSSNGTSWDITSQLKCGVLSANTDYWLKLEFTGSAYNVYVSTTRTFGNTPTATVASSSPIKTTEYSKFGINFESLYPWGGTIDLKESYININGKRWWTGYRKNIVLENEQHTEYDYILNENEQSFVLPLLDGSENIPDWKNVVIIDDIYIPNSGYLIQKDGYYGVMLSKDWAADSAVISVNGATIEVVNVSDPWQEARAVLRLSKGDIISSAGRVYEARIMQYIPIIGNGSLYYYVGDVAKNPSLVNVGAITNTLTKKVDIDAKNFSTSGKSLISSYAMPSNKYIDLALGASGTTYTAPANGWFMLATAYNGAHYITLDNQTSFVGCVTQQSSGTIKQSIPAKKGDIIYVEYNTLTSFQFKFIYAESEI